MPKRSRDENFGGRGRVRPTFRESIGFPRKKCRSPREEVLETASWSTPCPAGQTGMCVRRALKKSYTWNESRGRWSGDRKSVTGGKSSIHLDLALFSLVFDALEDGPRVPPPDLHSRQIAAIPLLDQNGRLYRCNGYRRKSEKEVLLRARL